MRFMATDPHAGCQQRHDPGRGIGFSQAVPCMRGCAVDDDRVPRGSNVRLNLLIVAVSATTSVVLILVAPRRAEACRLARLWQAQEKWAETMDRR